MPLVKQFEQTYYTSSAIGLTNRPGLQTKAASKGIASDTRRLIEAFVGGYSLPSTSDRSVEEGQPVSLKSFSAGQDLWCVSLTHYRKFDWDRRIGSFFAHNLVCSARDFLDCRANPFLLLHGFKKDDSGTALELPLAPIELQDRPLAGVLDALRRVSGDPSHLRDLLDALLTSRRSERPVVIVAASADVMALIEGVITLLPLSIRAGVSFSTYESPRQRPPLRVDSPSVPGATTMMLCSGTTGVRSGGGAYTTDEIDQSYFVFDWEGGRFSAIPASTSFSEWIASRVFEGDYPAVDACVRFLSLFNLQADEIDRALTLHRMPAVAASRTEGSRAAAIAFAESRSRTSEQAAASVERLSTLGPGSDEEHDAVSTALALAAHADLPETDRIYERFRHLVLAAAARGDATTVSAALRRAASLPLPLQLRAIDDLSAGPVDRAHVIEMIGAALRSGGSGMAQDSLATLVTTLVRLFDEALESGNWKLIDLMLTMRADLPRRTRAAFPLELQSKRGIGKQIALLEEAVALGVSDDHLSGGADRLRRRIGELLNEAVHTGQVIEASEIIARLLSPLPRPARRQAIAEYLDPTLTALDECLVAHPPLPGVEILAKHWVEVLLEDDPSNADRLQRVVALLGGPLTREARSAIWAVVRTQLQTRRVAFTPELLPALSAAARRSLAPDEVRRFVEDCLVPLLDLRHDKAVHAPVLLQLVEGSPHVTAELLDRLDLSLADARAMCVSSSSDALFDFYWERLGHGRNRRETVDELRRLYEARHSTLFTRAAVRLIQTQKNKGASLLELLEAVPAMVDDADGLSTLLHGCRRVADRSWAEMVVAMHSVLRTSRSTEGMRALARECVANMRDGLVHGESISDVEKKVLDDWIATGPAAADAPYVDAVVVFREVERLRVQGLAPSSLLSMQLKEFQQRKSGLMARDHAIAAGRVLLAMSTCEWVDGAEHWDAIEDVASQRATRQPIGAFCDSIETFFKACANRRDYARLLARVTVRMLTRWREYEPYRQVLTCGYGLLDGRKARAAYEEAVRESLGGEADGNSDAAGFVWWTGVIDPPGDKSWLGKLLGR